MSAVPELLNPLEVFYSYDPEDENLRIHLGKHLSFLRDKGTIKEWDFQKITAGSDQANEIVTHINSADIILLLISPSYLNSEQYKDIKNLALIRHSLNQTRVIPIILRPSYWEAEPFAHLKVLPTNREAATRWPNLDDAFVSIAKSIEEVVAGTYNTKTLNTKIIQAKKEDITQKRLFPSSTMSDDEKALESDSTAEQIRTPKQVRSARLIGKNREIELSNTQLTIGRTSDNDFVMEDMRVSAHHAEIHPQGPNYNIIDLKSRNGTFIYRTNKYYKLEPNVLTMLSTGDVVFMGSVYSFAYVENDAPTKPGFSIEDDTPTNPGYSLKEVFPLLPTTSPLQPPVPNPRKKRIGGSCSLKLSLFLMFGILFIFLAAISVNAYFTSLRTSSDQSTVLTMFCNALKSQQYGTAYNQLSSRDKSLITEPQFAKEFGGSAVSSTITNCVIHMSSAGNGSGTIVVIFSNHHIISDSYTMVQENGAWKINLNSP